MPKSESLPLASVATSPLTRWFSSRGSVVQRGPTSEVFVGGTLIVTVCGTAGSSARCGPGARQQRVLVLKLRETVRQLLHESLKGAS
jgi:hypothetical protein